MSPCLPVRYFQGKRALVTGGTRGIGAALAQALAQHGVRVHLNFRADRDSAQNTLTKIRQAGGEAHLARANLMRREEVTEMFRAISQQGGLDILVHAAALGSFKPTSQVRANQWDLAFNTDPRGFLLCVRESIPLMQESGGRIVSLSSLGGRRVIPNYGAIGVAKAAQEALVRYLAAELAPQDIRINAVAAGLVDSTSLLQHPHYDEMKSQTKARTPGNRIAKAEDVIPVVLFLCSPLADWICGQTIVVDGGMSLGL